MSDTCRRLEAFERFFLSAPNQNAKKGVHAFFRLEFIVFLAPDRRAKQECMRSLDWSFLQNRKDKRPLVFSIVCACQVFLRFQFVFQQVWILTGQVEPEAAPGITTQ